MTRYASRRVLALFPHPDDEAYAAGGLLARCAEGGAAVELVCATRGERGTDRSGTAAAGPALAALRTRELETSCHALGIAAPVFLDLPDGDLGGRTRADAVALVTHHVHRVRPHLLVTLGSDGAYGHLDHLAWTAIVSLALAPLAEGSRLLHAVFPRRLFAPVWRALKRRAGARLVAAIDPQTLGVVADGVDLRLDIRRVRGRKLAAISAHRSQLVDGDPYSFLRPGLVECLLDEEWYMVARGPALPRGTTDPFDGLR